MNRIILLISILFLSLTCNAESLVSGLDKDFVKVTLRDWIVKTSPKNISYMSATTIADLLYERADMSSVDMETLVGIVTVESRFDAKAVSREGAMGLMQVIPKYHKDKIKGRSLFDPKVALEVGTNIYLDCLSKAGRDHKKALACYSGSSGKKAVVYYQLVINKTKAFTEHLVLAMLNEQTALFKPRDYFLYS